MDARLKERLAEGRTAIGGWLTVNSPVVAAGMASLGFHWVAIDMEHGPIDETAAQAVFIALERHGAAPMVRMPHADPYHARRMLDLGAQGLIVPNVEDPTAFSEFLAHCLYPPAGRRGIGLSRCNGWGDSFAEYLAGFAPVIVAQIETAAGAAAAGAIGALPAVDALFLGPYDLSASLGASGDFETTSFKSAIASVREVCDTCGIAAGIHQVDPDPAALQARVDEGFRFVAYGTDVIAMRSALNLPETLK